MSCRLGADIWRYSAKGFPPDQPPSLTLSASIFQAFPGSRGGLVEGPSTSLFCMAASCLWRNTGLTYSSLPSGLSFRSCTLRASWNLTPFRASISSSSLARICGCAPSKKALGSALLGWRWGTFISHQRRYVPMVQRVRWNAGCCGVGRVLRLRGYSPVLGGTGRVPRLRGCSPVLGGTGRVLRLRVGGGGWDWLFTGCFLSLLSPSPAGGGMGAGVGGVSVRALIPFT